MDDPFEIGALRLTLASFVLMPFLLKNLKELKRKDYFILFISGIVGNVVPYFLYPIAQTKIDSATSGVYWFPSNNCINGCTSCS